MTSAFSEASFSSSVPASSIPSEWTETPSEPSPGPAETAPIKKDPLLEYPKEIQQGEEIFTAVPLDGDTLQAMAGKSWKDNPHIRPEELSLCTLAYVGLDGKRYLGQMVVANDAALDVTEIFQELYDGGFPIAQMRLIDAYHADDSASMADNNTSAFCYREIAGTSRLSNHSFGRAVDINPVQNPYLHGGAVEPSGDFLDRENVRPGMITRDGLCYQAFVSRGWKWGGDWTDPVDYQHFEKP